MTTQRKAAAAIGAAALVGAGYFAYVLAKFLEVRRLYGHDDRTWILALDAGAVLPLVAALAGWAVAVARGGRFQGRPAQWSRWMLAVLAATLVLFAGFGYDGGRGAADRYRATGGRGVPGTLAVTGCSAQEYGFECQGTFRADDGSFTVARVSAWPDEEPGGSLPGRVSGPRPLGMYGEGDGWTPALTPLYIDAALLLAGLALLVVAIAGRRRQAGGVTA